MVQELIRDFMELLVISDFQRHRVVHKLIYRNATTEMQWIGVLMVNNVGVRIWPSGLNSQRLKFPPMLALDKLPNTIAYMQRFCEN